MQVSAAEGSSQYLKPPLCLAVSRVGKNGQWRIEKNLLGFELTHTMLLRTLARVAVVPIEADDASKIDHLCILP